MAYDGFGRAGALLNQLSVIFADSLAGGKRRLALRGDRRIGDPPRGDVERGDRQYRRELHVTQQHFRVPCDGVRRQGRIGAHRAVRVSQQVGRKDIGYHLL